MAVIAAATARILQRPAMPICEAHSMAVPLIAVAARVSLPIATDVLLAHVRTLDQRQHAPRYLADELLRAQNVPGHFLLRLPRVLPRVRILGLRIGPVLLTEESPQRPDVV